MTAPRAARSSIVPLLALAGCAAAPAPASWHELLDGSGLGAFAVTDFGGQGAVEVREARLCLGIGSPLTGVTWTGELPPARYELELVGRRDLGGDFFCGLTFPVGDASLTLVLGGWGGTVCGLSSLDGLDAAHNDTCVRRSFATGRDYTVALDVSPERVRVLLDGTPLIACDLRGRSLGLRPEVLLSRPLGLATFATAASFARLRWRAKSA
jgi:hypothetical protein